MNHAFIISLLSVVNAAIAWINWRNAKGWADLADRIERDRRDELQFKTSDREPAPYEIFLRYQVNDELRRLGFDVVEFPHGAVWRIFFAITHFANVKG